jgi:hypothetical protein
MPSTDKPTDEQGVRVLFGACSECETPLYYPPLRVPSLVGIQWDPVDPTRAMAVMNNVCIKKQCYRKAIKKYREELERGDITIAGDRPMPHRPPAPGSPDRHPEETSNE